LSAAAPAPWLRCMAAASLAQGCVRYIPQIPCGFVPFSPSVMSSCLPAKPHPSYRRLSRYDETGPISLLSQRQVLALTGSTAVIESQTGMATVYRRHNKPAFGPLGDSLEDLS